eukprot:488012-Ditylum_brightwellii.AAC.1
MNQCMYGFIDASRQGFGSTLQTREVQCVHYCVGVWGSATSDCPSNFKELCNAADALEDEGKAGQLGGVEVFLLGDNQVAEATFYRGSSTNQSLLAELLQLRKFKLKYSCQILLIHCAGTRMIAQGTNGVSRGNMAEGVMRGANMMQFVPLHLMASEASPTLHTWIQSWAPREVEFLQPEGWFECGHDVIGRNTAENSLWHPWLEPEIYVWKPAPAAAAVAIEELRWARHKRQISSHIIVIPCLMAPYWRWALFKAADFITKIPASQ